MIRSRFSLRQLLVVVAVIAAVAALARTFHPYARQRRLEMEWETQGVILVFDSDRCADILYANEHPSGFRVESMRRLKEIPELRIVVLSGTSVTSKELTHLKVLSELTALSLNDTLVDDSGVRLVSSFQSLKYLHLRGTAITDESVSNLESMSGLEELDVSKTSISRDGVRRLRSNLPGTEIFSDHRRHPNE